MADKCRGCVVTAVRVWVLLCSACSARTSHKADAQKRHVCVFVFSSTRICVFMPGQDRLDRAIIPSPTSSHISFDQIRRKVHLPVKVFPSSTSLAFLTSHNIEMWGLSCVHKAWNTLSACIVRRAVSLGDFCDYLWMRLWMCNYFESCLAICEFCMLTQVLAECLFYWEESGSINNFAVWRFCRSIEGFLM